MLTAILIGLIAAPIIQQNVQKLAADRGWDTWLINTWPALTDNMNNLALYWWFWTGLGFVAGCIAWGWGTEWLYSQSVIENPATSAAVRLRFNGERQVPIEMKSENVPFWCAIYSPSASLSADEKSKPLMLIPPSWAITCILGRDTAYKQVVTRFYSDIGNDPPTVQVMQQGPRHFCISMSGPTTFGELDIYVQQ
jgi:hypothetical protein